MKCDNCKNKKICKYVEHVETLEDRIKGLPLGSIDGISIVIECAYRQAEPLINIKDLTNNPINNSKIMWNNLYVEEIK